MYILHDRLKSYSSIYYRLKHNLSNHSMYLVQYTIHSYYAVQLRANRAIMNKNLVDLLYNNQLSTIDTNTYKLNIYLPTFKNKTFKNTICKPIFETQNFLCYTITFSEDMLYPNKSYQLLILHNG